MKSILVPVDFSDVTDAVVEAAARIAVAFGSRFRLLHVVAPEPPYDFVGYEAGPQVVRDQVAHELREERRALQRLAEGVQQRGIDAETLFVQGPTIETILEQADTIDADLIALGSHSHGALHRALLGSVSEGVTRRSARPVLVVPARPKA